MEENCKNFYESQEERDLALLNKLNEREHYFDGAITGTPQFCHTDAFAKKVYSASTRYFTIELKERVQDTSTYKDLFIEPKKLAVLLFNELHNNGEGLYINFCADACYIFDISKINVPNLEVKHNVKIWDEGAKKYKYEDRFLLPKEYAIKKLPIK